MTEETNGREYFGLNPAKVRRETTVFLISRKSISRPEETWSVEIARFNRISKYCDFIPDILLESTISYYCKNLFYVAEA